MLPNWDPTEIQPAGRERSIISINEDLLATRGVGSWVGCCCSGSTITGKFVRYNGSATAGRFAVLLPQQACIPKCNEDDGAAGGVVSVHFTA